MILQQLKIWIFVSGIHIYHRPSFLFTATALALIQGLLMSPSGHLQQLQRSILSMYLPMQVLSHLEKVIFLLKTKYIENLPELTISSAFVRLGKMQTLIQMIHEIMYAT